MQKPQNALKNNTFRGWSAKWLNYRCWHTFKTRFSIETKFDSIQARTLIWYENVIKPNFGLEDPQLFSTFFFRTPKFF